MQQGPVDVGKLETLLETLQKDVKALKAGDREARARLVDGSTLLQRAIETPAERAFKNRFGFLQQFAVRICIENGVWTTLCAKGEPQITSTQLSEATGEDKLLIERLIRLLIAVGLIDEVAENTYKPNAITHFMNQPGMTGAEKHHFDLHTQLGQDLIRKMRTPPSSSHPSTSTSSTPSTGRIDQFNDLPGHIAPWEYSHAGQSFWKYLENDAESKRDFDLYMASRRQGDLVPEWFHLYPAAAELAPSDLKTGEEDVLLVDVAGGSGHDVAGFRKRFPHLPGRCVLQDLPETIASIEAKGGMGGGGGVECMPYDFFTPQPIKGARIYFFRNIAHDWSDLRCEEIFKNTVEAMERGYSRILFEDFVLPSTGAGFRAAAMDVHMLFSLAGIERTEGHWRRLLQGVGLEIVRIWSDGDGEHEGIVECRKV